MKALINNFIKRLFIILILFFSISFLLDKNIIKSKIIFTDMFDFSYFQSKVNVLLGKIISKKTMFVTSEKIKYKNIEKVNNSYKLIVDKNLVIKNLEDGVVTFIGNNEQLGNTVTIYTTNGVSISYSNLENISVNLYDYINKNSIIGSTKDDYFYLTIEKDNNYLSYENYI